MWWYGNVDLKILEIRKCEAWSVVSQCTVNGFLPHGPKPGLYLPGHQSEALPGSQLKRMRKENPFQVLATCRRKNADALHFAKACEPSEPQGRNRFVLDGCNQMASGKVIAIEGTPEKTKYRQFNPGRQSSHVRREYRMGDQTFSVSEKSFNAFIEGLRYRMYLLPKSKRLVNIEAIGAGSLTPSSR